MDLGDINEKIWKRWYFNKGRAKDSNDNNLIPKWYQTI